MAKQPVAKVVARSRAKRTCCSWWPGLCRVTNVTRHTWQENPVPLQVWVCPQDTNNCPPRREANGWPTGPVRLCSSVRMQELHRPPPSPSKASGPYRILAMYICDRLQWLELGQKGWLKQPLAKVVTDHEQRGPMVADDQWSCLCHQYKVTSLTGHPSSRSMGATPVMWTAAPRGRKQTVDPLDQWDFVVVWECRSFTISHFSALRQRIYSMPFHMTSTVLF